MQHALFVTVYYEMICYWEVLPGLLSKVRHICLYSHFRENVPCIICELIQYLNKGLQYSVLHGVNVMLQEYGGTSTCSGWPWCIRVF